MILRTINHHPSAVSTLGISWKDVSLGPERDRVVPNVPTEILVEFKNFITLKPLLYAFNKIRMKKYYFEVV